MAEGVISIRLTKRQLEKLIYDDLGWMHDTDAFTVTLQLKGLGEQPDGDAFTGRLHWVENGKAPSGDIE